MDYDEMLSGILFYTSIFDVRKTSALDISDPGGLVRSQESAGRGFRLTLNGAENQRTLAGQFVAGNFGPSVQNIASATSDIFKTAHALQANDFSFLQISPNYYHDLRARFGDAVADVERLRAYNILYDRDEQGEFFRLYSPVLGNGFFLEVVQRTPGYASYGAPNAIFRIAAQRRLFSGPAPMSR
jgi:4-hydroxyphenylpyruvate dioxygenase